MADLISLDDFCPVFLLQIGKDRTFPCPYLSGNPKYIYNLLSVLFAIAGLFCLVPVLSGMHIDLQANF